jgi:hypothetical protein
MYCKGIDRAGLHLETVSETLIYTKEAELSMQIKALGFMPSPAFVSRNQRRLDAMIKLTSKNQRLKKME